MSTTRAVIYTRISADPDGKQAGVQRQEELCRELAGHLSWEVAAVRTDDDVSAYSRKPRPGYRAVLDDLRKGRVDGVLAWHADRLYRRLPDLIELIDIVQASGAQIRTVQSGPIDLNTATGRMNAKILAAVAEHEIEHGMERMRAAKAEAAAQGKHRGGPRPFGYTRDGMQLVDAEAELIREAYKAVLRGESVRGIAAKWNKAGLFAEGRRQRQPDGSKSEPVTAEWTPAGVRYVLLRARNAGLVEVRGEEKGRGQWPVLVGEDEWRRVKDVLKHPSRRTTPGPGRVALLTGIAQCWCGAPVRRSTAGRTKTIGGKRGPVYRCSAGGESQHVARNCATVDTYIAELVLRRLERRDTASLPDRGTDREAVRLADQAEALRERMRVLRAKFARDEDMDEDEYDELRRENRAKLAEVERQMVARRGTEVLDGLTGPTARELWPNLPLDRQRAVVDALMSVTLLRGRRGRPAGYRPGDTYFDPDTVQIEWKSA